MGAYLSQAVTEKLSSDEINQFLSCGASSMQGWRISQEDAHNCLLDFDKDTSFFSVYDGHGGSEVAAYCAQNLPAFLKLLDSYKKGDFEKALKEAFLGFDSTLLKAEVIEVLKTLAKKNPDDDATTTEDEDDDENIADLRSEAALPLNEVLEKYKGTNPVIDKLREGGAAGSSKPLSPCLRGKRNLAGNDEGAGGSGSSSGSSPRRTNNSAAAAMSASASSSSTTKKVLSMDREDDGVSSSSCKVEGSVKVTGTAEPCSSSNSTVNESDVNVPDISSSSTKATEAAATAVKVNGEAEGSSEAKVTNASESSNATPSTTAAAIKSADVSSSSGSSSASKSQENGEVSPSKSANINNISSSNIEVPGGVQSVEDDEDDDSSMDDEEYNENEQTSSDEGVDDEEMDEDDTEEEDADDELNEEDEEFINNMMDEPGKDSGCTAVVALLHGKDLYVANAGDSRCVVCRKGEALEMSFDHKPEDDLERDRITKAGGRVTLDGRVNGGLNLSRAIGDHGYKMNEKLKPEEQMISALPDIKKISITPEDEFMVLACDGIWNFMTSKEVIDFVKQRLEKNKTKSMSKICEELFDNCLAPNTMGDGTGCDNMTAIIVQFKPLFTKGDSGETEPVSSRKRVAETDVDTGSTNGAGDEETKRLKLDTDEKTSTAALVVAAVVDDAETAPESGISSSS